MMPRELVDTGFSETPVDPASYPGWDEILAASSPCSFFHTSGWARVLCETYGYIPRYFVSASDHQFKLLFPVMEIKSRLTGCRGVSLPFSDYCTPITGEGFSPGEALAEIIRFGKRAGWKYLELRADRPLFGDTVTPYTGFYGHTLPLQADTQKLFRTFRKATQRNVRKAVKSGVAVTFHTSPHAVREYYRLHCLTRRRHGLPPQPFSFFDQIQKQILSRGEGFVALAGHHHRNIAGAVYFRFQDRAYYKFGAIDLNYARLYPFYLVMWEAIQLFSETGFLNLCFGRTETDNQGLIQFKDGWGTEKRPIRYYRYHLKHETFVRRRAGGNYGGPVNKIMTRAPIPVLKMAGSLLYRHMG